MKERVLFWDNLKGILIFFVVLGHYMYTAIISKGTCIYPYVYVYNLIHIVHMPFFAFISGYFSKDTEKCRKTAFDKLFVPYIVFNTIYCLMNYKNSGYMGFPLTQPYVQMWYLLALFVWRIVLHDVSKVKGLLGIAYVVSLLTAIAFPGVRGENIVKIITFFPFYLLGYYTSNDMINRIRAVNKLVGIIVLIALLVGVHCLVKRYDSLYEFATLRIHYGHDATGVKELMLEIIVNAFSLMFILCGINISTNKSSLITKWGGNTITIYLLHCIPGVREIVSFIGMELCGSVGAGIYILVVSIIITMILSAECVNKLYNYIIKKLLCIIRR